MKHVLMLPSWIENRWHGAGGGTFFIEQALIMREFAGWKVNILMPCVENAIKAARNNYSPSGGMEVRHADDLEIWLGYYCYYLPVSRRWMWCRFGERLFLEYVGRHGHPEALWVQSGDPAGHLARHLSQKHDIPYFIHEHSARYAYKPFSRRAQRRARNVIEGAMYCAAVSKDLRGRMLHQTGLNEDKICVVSNPVNTVFVNAELSRRSHGGVFVAVGLLRPDKNMDKILVAFSEFHREHPETRLVIVGDGIERERLEQLSRDMQLCDSVRFTGSQSREQVCSHMCSADYFISASDYETFGLALAEAMVCGLPVISNRYGIAETLVDEMTGVTLEKVSVEGIVEAMKTVIIRRYDSAHIRKSALEVVCPRIFARDVERLCKL